MESFIEALEVAQDQARRSAGMVHTLAGGCAERMGQAEKLVMHAQNV